MQNCNAQQLTIPHDKGAKVRAEDHLAERHCEGAIKAGEGHLEITVRKCLNAESRKC